MAQQSDRVSVFAETFNPDTWNSLEDYCQSSQGHLVSLTDNELEKELAKRSKLNSFWSGGNICPDSPAPSNSLWVSGKTQLQFNNFAPDSELDGNHCCIKVALNQFINASAINSTSSWKGEGCQSIMKGVCEFHITSFIDPPVNVSSTNATSDSVEVTWGTGGEFWQPNQFTVRYCHKRSLSRASMPAEDRCQEVKVPQGQRTVKIENLKPFSEYEITVIGGLPSFDGEASIVKTLRTRKYENLFQ